MIITQLQQQKRRLDEKTNKPIWNEEITKCIYTCTKLAYSIVLIRLCNIMWIYNDENCASIV